MTWIVMFVVLLAASVTQMLVPGLPWFGHVKAPLLLGVALYYSLNYSFVEALAVGCLAGFLHDVLSPIPLGYSMGVFCVAAGVACAFRRVVLTDALLTQIVVGAAAALAVNGTLAVLLFKGAFIEYGMRELAVRAGGAGVLGAFATPVVFSVVSALDRLVGNRAEQGEVKVNVIRRRF